MKNKENIIVIGGGHAGGMVSILLRKRGFEGAITIIGEEHLAPYERPQLSKSYLLDEIEFNRLQLRSEEFYKANQIDLVLGSKVRKIDRKKHTINLEDGRSLDYSKIIIATGSHCKRFNIEHSTKIHYLRTKAESDKIKSLINESKSVIIIGSGFIGLEVAAVSRKRKLKTSILELTDRVMSRSVSKDISNFFYEKHTSKGVNISFNTNISHIDTEDNMVNIISSNENIMSSDFVIVGIGAKPNINLAKESGLLCEDGILVNENCVTSDENIFAIGDCCKQHNDYLGRNIRLESVENAVEQAKIVATYISENSVSYRHVPWFWTKQYDLNLQIAGFIENKYKKKIVGSMQKEKFAIFHLYENKLKAVEAVNSQKSFMRGKKLIESGEEVSNDVFT